MLERIKFTGPAFCSLREPRSTSLVSCRAAISIFSLENDLSNTPVFLVSSICWRSSVTPGRMVFAFQLAMLSMENSFSSWFCLVQGL